jgi:diguanylate cyclase (GGDEF)-like protein
VAEAGRPRGLRTGLQAKLLGVVVLCVVVPVTIIGVHLLRRNQQVLREKVEEGLSSHLLRKEAAVEDWIRERVQDATRWSASFVIYEGFDALAARGDSAEARDLHAYLDSLLGHYRVYESLFIVDLQGRVLSATREEQLEPWAVELIRQKDPSDVMVSPLRRSEALGRPTLLVLKAVTDPRRNQTLGYFVARIDVHELEALLSADASEIAPAPWLLSPRGEVLARAGKVVADPGTTPFPLPVPRGEAAGDAVIAEANLPELGAAIFALRNVGGPFPARLAAIVPQEIAFRSLAESRRGLILTGLAAIFLIGLLNFVGTRRVLQPILLLSEGAKRVAAGDLDVYLPVRGSDEIADLTRAFNDMAHRIREGRESLETARDELANANEGLRAANRTLETLAITDGLTSLYNHRHFQETFEKEILRSEQAGRPLTLLLIDIDHFKHYNDRWGHQEGDAALRRVAAQITKGIRSTDMAFRYGGEELAVLLPSCPKPQATEVADKLRLAIRNHTHRQGRAGERLTVSVGVAAYPEDGRVARVLVDMADAALYAAKSAGRDRVVVSGALPAPAPAPAPAANTESTG